MERDFASVFGPLVLSSIFKNLFGALHKMGDTTHFGDHGTIRRYIVLKLCRMCLLSSMASIVASYLLQPGIYRDFSPRKTRVILCILTLIPHAHLERIGAKAEVMIVVGCHPERIFGQIAGYSSTL